MKVQVAMLRHGQGARKVLCVARPVSRIGCPVVGPALYQRVRGLVAELPLVLIFRDARGELRSYGDVHDTAAVLRMDLTDQLWAEFELDEGGPVKPDAEAA